MVPPSQVSADITPASTGAYQEFLLHSSASVLREPEAAPALLPGAAPATVDQDELAWQSRWFAGDFGREFTALTGQRIRIADFGWWNRGAGPDFRDCVVEIDGTARRGSIELDPSPRDWEAHGHSANPAYDDTVLHLLLHRGAGTHFTRTSENREVLQVLLDPSSCPDSGGERHAPARPGRCVETLAALPQEQVIALMEDAARYRLQQKARRWRRIADIHGLDQAIYQAVAEALGYSRNKLPMSILAQQLPLKYLLSRPAGAEALLYGAAGFLDGREPGHDDPDTRAWLRSLWESWWKYRAAFTPGPASRSIRWVLSGTRPVNHPQRRIAALRQIVLHWKPFRRLLEPAAFDGKAFTSFLESLTHPYWSTHYTLTAKPSSAPLALLGTQRIRDLMANVVYPLLLPERPALWQHYARLPAPAETSKTDIAGIRLFGTAERAAAFSGRLWQHQALLQIYADFCLSGEGGCCQCPFPEQSEKSARARTSAPSSSTDSAAPS